MVEDRIRTIEARVSSANLPDAAKTELLELLALLRSELQSVKKEHLERAEESSRPADGESLHEAVGGLTDTMTELEAVHPRLAALANRLAVALANMGI